MDTRPRPSMLKPMIFVGLVSGFLAFSQQRPLDSISIRKDYTIPDPTYYDAFYDVATNTYFLYPKIGNVVTGPPIAMTPTEYSQYILAEKLRKYYREKSEQNDLLHRKDPGKSIAKSLLPSVNIRNKLFETIFGGDKIELIPQGFASFDLGALYQKIDNPLILPQNRTSFAINIQQRIQLGITGKVGKNLQLRANYDTQSGFAFENKLNLIWQAKGTWQDLQTKGLAATEGEDKIIKRVEFGNVNMPLSTGLIRGSESLFGLKTEFQLGKTYGTAVFSQQQGEARNIVVQGGGVMNTFKINAIDYEDNQHYYIGQYFFRNYDAALENYPLINSRINITRIEAWVIDQGSANLQDQKSILGIRDLGESGSLPDNGTLYQQITALGAGIRDANTAYNTIKGQSFPGPNGTPEVYSDGEQFIFNRRARRLRSNEFTFHPQLGYISLNQRLNDNQLLAVSYSYTLNGSSTVYKVGEFSEESPVLITKVLKPNVSVKTASPMWDLMMKNIYSLEANQIERDGFVLNVNYRDPISGNVNYLPNTPVQDTPLLNLLNWDRLNQSNDVQNNGNTLGDGIFDFVQGITVDAPNGKIMFTKAQPFGSYMQSVLGSSDPKYVFNDLYTQQKQVASQNSLALRYSMEGRFKGATGSGIPLGAINVPQGSVKVTANGQQLVEGQDFTVDYMLGTVTIINEAVKNSGQAINISLENQLTFNTQRKTFIGLNLERKFNEHLLAGVTAVNYSERPLTQKVQLGNESVNNSMFGFNILYNNELPFLTRLTDKIPFVNTEAPSHLNFKAEAAYLLPGQNRGIDDQAYIDDFEQTTSKISLKEPAQWALASKPEKNPDAIFNTANLTDNLLHGNGRALMSWYYIDPRFYGIGGKAPEGISPQSLSNHASRRVESRELYNNRDYVAGEQTFINTFDITYYPKERGPYNFNPNPESPLDRWGGLMRALSVSNFTQSNIEYVEFWMQDPYADGNIPATAPRLLMHLGNVSEDVLKDGKLQYENGLPTPSTPSKTSETNWGIQPDQQPVLYAFSSDAAERTLQDVGYDGLNNEQEAAKFGYAYTNPVTQKSDPAGDDFVFPLSNVFPSSLASSVAERYRYFRNPEGNSKANSMEVATQTPDAEDVNRDYNLDQSEDYNQYSILLDKDNLAVGKNFIVDSKEVNVRFQNGQSSKVKWFLFRVPVAQYDEGVGAADPSILNNVRFMRMLVTGFEDTSTLRFGSLDLVRSDWRKYTKNFANSTNQNEGSVLVDNSGFDVGSVNLEENGLGAPPYVLPPGIERQVLSGNAGAQRQNEASLYMKFRSLGEEAKGVFKNVALDMRRYRNLELFVHAENLLNPGASYVDANTKFFIRLGSDATDNYYEYETTLKYTPNTANSPFDIWPAENTVRLDVRSLVDAKLRRDKLSVPLDTRFRDPEFGDGNKGIITKGRPSLGNVTTIVLGIRNESSIRKDIVLWVNELRLQGIENKGGYAGNASIDFNLGDFATVNAAGSYSSIGFGGIDQKPVERAQSSLTAFNVNTTVNVDKFLPEKSGLKIPVNYNYSQSAEDPKYNPINNDVLFDKDPDRDELKKVARTYSQQRSVNLLNVHKERTNTAKPQRFYDVENLAVTALYSDDYYRDVYTKKNYRQSLKAYIDYNYNFKPWVLKPFKNIVSDTAKAAKNLRWVKEFNFNPVPTRVSFRTEIDRAYTELEYRNIDAILSAGNNRLAFPSIRNNNFYFGWQYNLGFNLTKSLKADIFSTTRTLNDNFALQDLSQRSVFMQPFRAGRPVLYNHRVQLNYRLPFEFIPFMDFVTAEAGYAFQYNWNARSTALLSSPEGSLGHIAQNTNEKVLTVSANVPSFFNKFSYFQKIDSVQQARRQEIDSLNNVYNQRFAKKTRKRMPFKKYKFKNKLTPVQAVLASLTSVKQVNISFNENNGTALPGLLSAPNFFGVGQTLGGPTPGFLLGSQADIRRIAIENNWLSTSSLMNDPYTQLKNQTLNGSVQIQPINDLMVDLNLLRTYTRNFVQGGFNVDADPSTPFFDFSFGNDLITYSRSSLMLGTAFLSGDAVYRNMVANAKQISVAAGGPPGPDGFAEGYSLANSYVLVPAFQAAVEGKQVAGLVTEPTRVRFPAINWKITYSGLRNIPLINSRFSKLDIMHAYNSAYTATGIQSNIDFYDKPYGTDINGDRINPYIFGQVLYTEDFSPLIGADFTLRNNVQIRAMYNKNRMFLLGLANHTLTEDSGTEYVVGAGYIMKDLRLKMRFGGKPKTLKSDLNVRADFALRDNLTRITNILMDDSQVTGGQRLLSVRFSADYNVSQNFNLRFFYDQMMSSYKISTAYPLTTLRAGLTATFTFNGPGF